MGVYQFTLKMEKSIANIITGKCCTPVAVVRAVLKPKFEEPKFYCSYFFLKHASYVVKIHKNCLGKAKGNLILVYILLQIIKIFT